VTLQTTEHRESGSLGNDALLHYTTVAVPELATIFGAGWFFLPLGLGVIRALRTRNV
jgi:hypothetical protein